MFERLKTLIHSARQALARRLRRASGATPDAQAQTGTAAAPAQADPIPPVPAAAPAPVPAPAPRRPIDLRPVVRLAVLAALVAALAGAGYGLLRHPPVQQVADDELGIRSNRLTGRSSVWRGQAVWVLPGVHELATVSLRDRQWRASAMASASGAAPAQSVEGLSVGIDLSVRYALDPAPLQSGAVRRVPEDLGAGIVEPAVQATVYRIIARHTVREIFSSQRSAIEEEITQQIRTRLAADGLLLRGIHIGRIDLPADYRRGMEGLLNEGLAAEKMRYTLELRDKQVKERELQAAAEKARREVEAEAAAREQVIAARAQEEAMKHVLPLKQRQIEQRKLEAEAARVARVQQAEGEAQARRIEAQGEADARQRLADAEAYRLRNLGQVNAEQMAVEGALITRHPLLIQKTMADRLSDKVQVIIAPPAAGGFIGNALLGGTAQAHAASARHGAADGGEEQ